MLKLLTRLDRSFALGIACRGERHVWKVAKGSLPGPHTVYWILQPRGRHGMTGSGLGFGAVEAFLQWSCIASIHGFLHFLVGIGGSTLVVLFRCKAARIFSSRALMPRLTVLFTPRFSLPVSLRSSLSAVLWFPDACAVDSLSAVFSVSSGPSLVSSLGSTLTFWSDGAELSAEQSLAGGTSAVLPTS